MVPKKEGSRGSVTVEAAVIVPIVIIGVIVMLYILMLIFQSCVLQITANHIAERAAGMYNKGAAELITGSISPKSISNLGIYRRWSSELPQKNRLKEEAESLLQKNSVLKSNSIDIEIQEKGTPIARSVNVQLRASYVNPLGELLKIWGLHSKINLTADAKATVKDPAEFIRNTDYVIETAAKIPVLKEFSGQWQEIIKKIIDYINQMTKEH